ncbi:cytochrome c, partial [Escherichia coli]|nr:cytochrome c [Escherichia coli]
MTARRTFLTLAACLAALPALADEMDPGQALFLDNCATCHGAGARGDGPMAEFMTLPVPDLTGLTERYGGQFPLLEVIHVIDGRQLLRGHGGPMPIFGLELGGDSVALD